MNHTFRNRSVISIENFSTQEILYLLEKAHIMKNSPFLPSLKISILATCFYEPSTRTRLLFEASMLKLGGGVIGFSNGKNTAAQKGESLEDTIRVKESIHLAHKSTQGPVINAGNGTEEHPTQTLTDLFATQETQKNLKRLSVTFLWDLKYGCTVHFLCIACVLFDMHLFFYSPNGLFLPQEILAHLTRKKIQFSFHQSLDEIIPYTTHLQTHKLISTDPTFFNLYPLKLEHLANAPSHLKILYPLPKAKEKGLCLYCEVTHHLFLLIKAYDSLRTKAQVNSHLPQQVHSDGLWRTIREKMVDTIGSDHAPHILEGKSANYPRNLSGVPGIEITLPLLLDACNQGKIQLSDIEQVMRKKILEIFRLPLYRGIVLVDMQKTQVIYPSVLQTKYSWSPYADLTLKGWPIMTVLGDNLYACH